MKGILVLDASEYDEDEVMMKVMELPMLDFKNEDGALIIETEPNKLLEVKKGLEDQGIVNFLTSEVTKIANSKVALEDDKAAKLQNLIDALEDDDDVSEVHTNVE
jgi:transcriptional/translational regulatory protein YebC/TACO1